MVIDEKENIDQIKTFLENNTIFKIGTTTKDGVSYLEANSLNGSKILVNKVVLTSEIFFMIMNRFVQSRDEIIDQKYNKYFKYNINSEQGEANISFEGNTCKITLYTSICDSNILVPSDREFLIRVLSMIDNGSEPILSTKDGEKFTLLFGNQLTISFDKNLLKYIEEYSVCSKHTQEYNMRLERKNKNEK